MSIVKRILEAAGIFTPLPPGVTEGEIADKIIADHLVGQRALGIVVLANAEQALREMHPIEREALIKRLGLAPKPATQSTGITWSVEQTDRGQVYILAQAPKKDMGQGVFAPGAALRFTGNPAQAHAFSFVGQHPSPEILNEYRSKWQPMEWTAETK